MKTTLKQPADYIQPLNINGLEGRMLHVPAPPKKHREILLLYGHHAKLERWWSLVENLQQYGSVTMPDLPGFGGMDSFYRVHRRPTIDAFADYLADYKITLQAQTYNDCRHFIWIRSRDANVTALPRAYEKS